MEEEQLVRITDMLENFNFHKVQIAMSAVDWKYYDSPWEYWNRGKVPSVKELKTYVFQLAKDLYTNPNAKSTEGDLQIESGGFKLKEVGGQLSLEFILEDYNENDEQK